VESRPAARAREREVPEAGAQLNTVGETHSTQQRHTDVGVVFVSEVRGLAVGNSMCRKITVCFGKRKKKSKKKTKRK
jgi:hypothetical protein